MRWQFDVEKKLIITVSIFALLIIGIGAIIVYPTVRQIKTINQDTENLRVYLERRNQNVMGLRTAKFQASEIKETVASFVNYFYYPEQELKLITELENISARFQITQKIDNYEIIDGRAKISLNAGGEYLNLIKYLSEIENLNYFIHTDSLLLTTEGEGKGEKLHLELSLYVNSQ